MLYMKIVNVKVVYQLEINFKIKLKKNIYIYAHA